MGRGNKRPPSTSTKDDVDVPDLDKEKAAERKAIEEGAMRTEVKHIDKKWTEKGQAYYTETEEEEIPEQVDWWYATLSTDLGASWTPINGVVDYI